MYSVADIAKLFNVDNKNVKDWTYFFSEYLSKSSNPPKGQQRFYTVEDIRIFAYVLLYWEDEPDIEHIKFGLNSYEYYNIENINNLITQITPIFQEPYEEIASVENNVLFAGMASLDNQLSLANAFKESGDILFERIKEQDNLYDFASPILYQYRHSIELYLKSILRNPPKTHNLLKLYARFETLVKTKFQTAIPSWLKEMIVGFNKIDPRGDIFRYGEDIARYEILVDLLHLKVKISWFAKSINNIYYKLKSP
ncbi:MAG: hypothetical protein LBJ60_00425 [Tannerellaceae bacterium]|jgi:hypothetical protein|nr:hypothetical protein [Tannerellaceae bacterium]